ncbi:hypothetical protein BX666DRAFT_2126569 [Dichotomocladium elegans]|nr:hypothetical protein BX666DRAFT_2126569 [Dichotomocladium elegans]
MPVTTFANTISTHLTMSVASSSSEATWATVTARKSASRIPAPLKKVHDGQRERFVAKLLYEAPDVAAYLRSQQITSIVHSTLTSGSVIFKFPSKIFDHYTDAYRLITDQLGPFKSDDANTKAISHGVTVEHVTYKASRFVDKVDTTFTRVNLTLFQFEDEATLISKLKKSMAIYGKVCQIKMLTNRGFFEGELSILLDTSGRDDDDPSPVQPLDRKLFLSEWDTLAPASWKGAPPVCYYCRQAGHVRKDCPALQNLTCYKCHRKGHIRRNCRMADVPVPVLNVNEQSDTDAIAEYEVLSELTHKERPTDSPTHSSTINDESGLIIPKKAKRYATRSTTAKASVDHTLSPFNTPTGTAGSKYASITVAASMALDEPATPAPSDANTSSATTPLHSRLTPAHTDDMDLIIDADTTPPNIVMTAQEGNE